MLIFDTKEYVVIHLFINLLNTLWFLLKKIAYFEWILDCKNAGFRFNSYRLKSPIENHDFIQPKVPSGLIARCGFFTVFSTYVTFTGFTIFGYEFWSNLIRKKHQEGIFTKVFCYLLIFIFFNWIGA